MTQQDTAAVTTQVDSFDVYAQGLAVAPFRTGLPRDEAIALAGRLAATEGAVWVRPTGSTRPRAERVYANGTVENWDLDEDGLPLGSL